MNVIPDVDSTVALAPVKIFCSYRRVDNDSIFKDAVGHLVGDMKSLHEAETGRPLDIFFDREELGWGDNFREAIDQAVHEATFFMPIITARYFDSEWCRHEFLTFYGKSRALGVTELILPIVFAGISYIRVDSPDKIAATIAEIQYSDWSDLWQEGRESSAWRTDLTRLVRRIVELRAIVEMQLAEQALSDSRLEDIANGASPVTGASLQGPVKESVMQLHQHGSSVLEEAERVVADVTDFFNSLDQAVRAMSGDPRLAHARLSGEFIARAHSIEREAGDMLTDALDFDVALRTQRRSGGSAVDRKQLTETIQLTQTRAARMEDRINALVFVPTLIRRLDSTLGLRPIVSPARVTMQTVRDLLQFLYGWTALEA